MQKSRLYFLLKQRHTRRTQKTRKNRRFLSGAAKGFLAFLLVGAASLIFWAGWEYSRVSTNLPAVEELPLLLNRQNGELLTPTRIYDRSGKVLLSELGTPAEARRFLSIDPSVDGHFNPQLLKTAVNLLQPNYWTSSGEALSQLTDPVPGTIAERLVMELLLSNESPSSLRALRMHLLASQILHEYGKSQVLEWYLNSAALGSNTFGMDAAAHLYLGKSAQDLTLAESALLVSLIDSPALNPLDSPTASADLQRSALAKLRQQESITRDEYLSAMQEKLPIQAAKPPVTNSYAAVVRRLESQLESTLGVNRLQRGGLVITSTLDADLQNQLQCAALTQLNRIESSPISGVASEPANCQAALLLPTQSYAEPLSGLAVRGIILDPQTGQVLAYLPPITQFGEVLADDPAQPGSLLAPVIALAGFARGESPASLMWDIPASLPASLSGAANPDGTFHGPVSLRSAVANDYLVPLANLAQQINPAVVWQMGSSLGLDSLGSSASPLQELFNGGSLSIFELSQTYATLANSGTRSGVLNTVSQQLDLNLALSVESTSQRKMLDLSSPQQRSIVSGSLAYLMNHVLSDDAARRPSLGYPNALQVSFPAAAKVGQTQFRDQVWTVGYTPHRLVLIGVQQTDQSGGTASLQPVMAAGVWNSMIQYASKGLPTEGWTKPNDVSEVAVCSPSGLLPTAACPNVVTEVFLNGNEPVSPDNLYRKVEINRETGLLATVFTPASLVEQRVTMDVPAEARDWALAAGLPLTPARYDAIQTVAQDPQVHISSPALFSPVHGKVEILGTAADTAFKSYSVQVGEGINPTTWIQVGTTGDKPVSESLLATWDTSNLDGLFAVRLTVVNQANQLKTAVIQVTVDNAPPQAAVVYPQPEASVTPVLGVITFSARAVDNVSVSRVEWWLDGKLLSESDTSPYTLVWKATSGKHTLMVKAFDTAGNQASSAQVIFTVVQ
ncbi:MAG: transglycosylase domain-containing protein [Anaerolineaceae bacterium]